MPLSDCLPIEIEQVRARIVINSYVIETPFVKSFNITKSRTSLSNSFSATIEVPVNASFGGLNGNIYIYAGTKQNYLNRKIFTGTIRQVTANPSPGKPNYMLLNISGNDKMYKLENKRFSRRIPTDGPGVFVTITGSKTQRTSGVWTIDKNIRTGKTTYTDKLPGLDSQKQGPGSTAGRKPTVVTTSPGKLGTSDLTVHGHDSNNTGGPSFGRFAPRITNT